MTEKMDLLKNLVQCEQHIRPVRTDATDAIKGGSAGGENGLDTFQNQRPKNDEHLRAADTLLKAAENSAVTYLGQGAGDILIGIRQVRDAFDQAMVEFDDSWHDKSVERILDTLQVTMDRIHSVIVRLEQDVGDAKTSDIESRLGEIEEMGREKRGAHDSYNDDIIASLAELKRCFAEGCYIACMCLCGRMMEASLRMRFTQIPRNDQIRLYNTLMKTHLSTIGAREVDKLYPADFVEMFRTSDPRKDEFHLPEGMANDVEKIRRFRNSYAHAKRKDEAPIPSKDETMSVICVLAEVLTRTYTFIARVHDTRNTRSAHF